MTTNQTIDGVRKLAEQACGTSPDSPAYRRFIAAMNPTLLLDLTSPDAQPRGEPIYQLEYLGAGGGGWNDVDKSTFDRFKRLPNYQPRIVYAEPPAPVAVPRLEMANVVRAHMEITGCPVLTSNQCHALAMKLNTCLDAVTRLNSTRPTHAIPPPGTEPSGTYHDNDGLDEMRKPK